MEWNLLFFVNSILLGFGLAMDAFSVSLVNGLNENNMKKTRMFLISGTYSFFQFIMPMLGWFIVQTLVQFFEHFSKFLPLISLLLLLVIGIKMIIEAIKNHDIEEKDELKKLDFLTLILQGIATSIDALSVGFTTATLNIHMAVISAVIIAAVTYLVCYAGLCIGKKIGAKLSSKASIGGGIILILIGIEIFIRGFFFS